MGKRSDFERKSRDFYPTPMEAVEPLLEHLPENFLFVEPCAGNGALIEHLETKGICTWASDIEPQAEGIHKCDYSDVGFDEFTYDSFSEGEKMRIDFGTSVYMESCCKDEEQHQH